MIIRFYGIGARNRAAAIALAAAALALGAVFLAFGIVLLLGLAAVGTLVGAGALVLRALTGRGKSRIGGARADSGLDPALEVFPAERASTAPPPLTGSSSEAHAPE